MRYLHEWMKSGRVGGAVMYDDPVSGVVAQFDDYHIMGYHKDGFGRVLERATITLSREEMLKVVADFQALEAQDQRRREPQPLEEPSRLERAFMGLLTITRR